MVTFGYWVSPWVELIYQEFPGSVPTFSEIAAYEERAREGRKAQSIRATELVVWCVGVRDQLEFHDYDFQAADMRAIQLLAVRWMVAGKRSAHDDQRHAWEVIRQSSKPHHPAWTIVLDTHFPID